MLFGKLHLPPTILFCVIYSPNNLNRDSGQMFLPSAQLVAQTQKGTPAHPWLLLPVSQRSVMGLSTSSVTTFELYMRSTLKGQSSLPRHLSLECSKQATLPSCHISGASEDLARRQRCLVFPGSGEDGLGLPGPSCHTGNRLGLSAGVF